MDIKEITMYKIGERVFETRKDAELHVLHNDFIEKVCKVLGLSKDSQGPVEELADILGGLEAPHEKLLSEGVRVAALALILHGQHAEAPGLAHDRYIKGYIEGTLELDPRSCLGMACTTYKVPDATKPDGFRFISNQEIPMTPFERMFTETEVRKLLKSCLQAKWNG
jgi:hypothetical protein